MVGGDTLVTTHHVRTYSTCACGYYYIERIQCKVYTHVHVLGKKGLQWYMEQGRHSGGRDLTHNCAN